MQQMMHWISFMVLSWATTVPVQGQQLSIRAASAQPVEGWQRMQVEHSDRIIWVSPTSSITAGDIEKAQPQVRPDGDTVIAVVFTDAGAEKMQTFTRAQMKKLVALVVDGRVVWAPIVQTEFSKQAVLTGNGPHGLTQEEVDRILASLR